MKIGIIGVGNVGGTLGRRWAQGGHEVVFGVRDVQNVKRSEVLSAAGPNARVASVGEAAAASEVVVFATPWSATEDAVRSAGELRGKVLVDCTNPIAPGMKGLSIGQDTSAAEKIASWAKGARVVKAFSTTGAANMADPNYAGERATMFLCGDDKEAKQNVGQLAEELGFDVCDTGALYTARYLEPLAMLWVHLAYVEGLGPNFAFTLLRR
jgi:hypothetical protein